MSFTGVSWKGAPHLLSIFANAPLGLMPLTEGGVHLLVACKEHFSVQSSACVSCGQNVINALLISMTLRGQVLTCRVVFQKFRSKNRSEVGRQIVVPLAKEVCSIDFPYNT